MSPKKKAAPRTRKPIRKKSIESSHADLRKGFPTTKKPRKKQKTQKSDKG